MTFESWERLVIGGLVAAGFAWLGRGYYDRRKRDDQALTAPGDIKEWTRTHFVSTISCDACKSHQAAEDTHVVRELRDFKGEVLLRLGKIEDWMRNLNGNAQAALQRTRVGDEQEFDPATVRTRGGERQD